jgi:hypothetical protein
MLNMKDRPRICYTEEQKALMWGRWQKGESLGIGNQKINLRQRGRELKPGALNVDTGSADLCLIY